MYFPKSFPNKMYFPKETYREECGYANGILKGVQNGSTCGIYRLLTTPELHTTKPNAQPTQVERTKFVGDAKFTSTEKVVRRVREGKLRCVALFVLWAAARGVVRVLYRPSNARPFLPSGLFKKHCSKVAYEGPRRAPTVLHRGKQDEYS